MKKSQQIIASFIFTLLFAPAVKAESIPVTGKNAEGYVANSDTVRTFASALSAEMKKAIVVSNVAAKKRVTGNFSMANPADTLEKICAQLGLIWYYDGQAIYIYDASESRNAVFTMRNTNVDSLKRFLTTSGLYDERYPLRSEMSSQTFYIAGPPVWVDLVLKTANYLDQVAIEDIKGNISVIPLFNTFAEDRTYSYRDQSITIPGIASVINSLAKSKLPVSKVQSSSPEIPNEPRDSISMPSFPDVAANNGGVSADISNIISGENEDYPLTVVANPDNNSLIVKGSPAQISNVKSVVSILDVPKRHVEMSVWIVDLQKSDLEQLGVRWNGSINLGSNIGASFNATDMSSTVDGATFMAAVTALSNRKKANIVSRPMILTQENVPAIFDNSRTFYTKLIGERTTSLEHVTYGTSLNVLPRFASNGEIEMMLSVEDGNQFDTNVNQDGRLPDVGRTSISTIARVPKGKSLLIGGYTRDESSTSTEGIPVLKDIPYLGRIFKFGQNNSSNVVRVFLIQPREIQAPKAKDGTSLIARLRGAGAKEEMVDWMNNFVDNQH